MRRKSLSYRVRRSGRISSLSPERGHSCPQQGPSSLPVYLCSQAISTSDAAADSNVRAPRPWQWRDTPKRSCGQAAAIGVAFCVGPFYLPGAEAIATNAAPKFIGATSCASSSCHGGGGQNQNQFLVWSLRDFHSQ